MNGGVWRRKGILPVSLQDGRMNGRFAGPLHFQLTIQPGSKPASNARAAALVDTAATAFLNRSEAQEVNQATVQCRLVKYEPHVLGQ